METRTKKEKLEEALTITKIAKAMHVDYYYILREILSGNLVAMPIMGKRRTTYRIEPKDYEEWKKNLKMVMLRNIKLSTGPEPECGREWAKKLIGVS